MGVPESIPLNKALPNQFAIISRVDVPVESAARLMALGLCTGRKVQVVKRGDPMIVRVLGSQVGLSARLAEMIRVRLSQCQSPPPSAA